MGELPIMSKSSSAAQQRFRSAIETVGMMRLWWAVLFLALSTLTGWMVFVWSESVAEAAGPTADVLFLVCVACFLSTSVAAAVQRLHRQTGAAMRLTRDRL